MASKITRIGLTGGVGSGKTCVGRLLVEAGIPVIDLDRVGRELTENRPEIAARVAEICGLPPKGELDRLKVREIIFADSTRRGNLEAYLHPLITQEFEQRCQDLIAAGKRLVICEAALLVETGFHKSLDGLIVVSATDGTRQHRLMERDKIPALLAEKMLRAQAADVDKRGSATTVIENEGSLEALALQVHALVEAWRAQGLL